MTYSHYIHHDNVALTYANKVLANGYVRANVRRYYEAVSAAPDLCLIPDVFKHRHRVVQPGEKPVRHNVSYRTLLWLYQEGYVPELGFRPPTCGTRHCINPRHQQPIEAVGGKYKQCEPVGQQHGEDNA